MANCGNNLRILLSGIALPQVARQSSGKGRFSLRNAVSSNQEEAIILAMNHLRSQGHTHILMCPMRTTNKRVQNLRRRTYEDYVEAHGLVSYREIYPYHLDLNMPEAEEAALALLFGPEPSRPTAMISGAQGALWLLKRAREKGFGVPSDVSIMGIDDVSYAPLSDPALTTIDTRNDEIARAALSLLLARIKEPKRAFQKTYINPRLVIRASTGACPCAVGKPLVLAESRHASDGEGGLL